MKYDFKYIGKWVATKNSEIVAADKSLITLRTKLNQRSDAEELRYVLIPKGRLAGYNGF